VGRLRALAIVLAVAGLAFALWPREDDLLVDASHPRARQAVAIAREVVPGSVVDVRRDRDNGKWEVTMRQDGREYEVELAPGDLALLRVDYD
jgi:Peptidase propeptide and YPEB domain